MYIHVQIRMYVPSSGHGKILYVFIPFDWHACKFGRMLIIVERGTGKVY